MKRIRIWAILLVVFSACAEGPRELTTFILIRHAEKGNDGTKDPDLTEQGRDRAEKLAAMLKDTPLTGIYSTNFKRTRQTAEPLAKIQNLDIQLFEAFKPDILENLIQEHRGGIVLISGHSDTTPWTANLLIGKEFYKDYAESEYGIILILSVGNLGSTATVTRINY